MNKINQTFNGHISQIPQAKAIFAMRKINHREYLIPYTDIFYINQQEHISIATVDQRVNMQCSCIYDHSFYMDSRLCYVKVSIADIAKYIGLKYS